VSSIAIAQAMSIASNHTNIMSMSSSNSIVYRQSIGNLSNGVWLSLSLAIVPTNMSIAKTMAIGDTCDHSNIVSTARSNGMGNRETMSNLSNGVWLGLTLAIVSIMPVSNSSYNPNIVRVSSSIGIVDGKSMSNLANGVGVTVSFTLAIESTVANSSIASNMTIAIVNTSDYTTIASTIGNLANGVGVTVTLDRGNNKEDLKERILIIQSNKFISFNVLKTFLTYQCTSSHDEQSQKTGNHLQLSSLFIAHPAGLARVLGI
jgi:hypothetical protein